MRARAGVDDRGRARKRRDLLSDVFELFPYGIAIAIETGAIFVWNRAFGELTGLGPDELRTTCCALFGCRVPGTPLEGSCVTEAALAAGDEGFEVELPAPGGAGALVVTATTLRSESWRVVIGVRAVDAREHPPRAPAARGDTPWLRVFTLGRTRAETADGPVSDRWLEQRAGQLLKLLVCERHRVVATEEIAEALWHNARAATPNTVRHFVHELRERLEPGRQKHARSALVIARRGGYTLSRENVWVDADEFESSARGGLDALAHGDRATATARLEHALALYHGDFLADDPYAEWALAERERLRCLVEPPLRALSELHADDPETASGYLERLAELEPFDQAVQRDLLDLWIRQGRLSRAVRHYHAFELRLLREFSEQPEFSLAELGPSRR